MDYQRENQTEVQYLSLGQRSCAAFVDGVVQLLAISVTSWMWDAAVGPGEASDLALMAINLLAPTALVLFLWSQLAVTPGMLIYSAKIVDANTGLTPSSMQMTIRFFGSIVCAMSLGLGFLWAVFSPRNQGVHDLMAGTVVVFGGKLGED